MTIRTARANDHWRRTFSRNYVTKYERIGFANLFCLGTGTLSFRGGITAIVGGNGIGKSTIAAALGELLGESTSEKFLGNHVRLSDSKLEGELIENGATRIRKATGPAGPDREVTGDNIDAESRWLDPGFLAFHTRAQVVRDPNFADLIEPVTPIELGGEDLETIGYLAGKEYEKCLIYEIPDYADFDRFPYIRVRAHGVEYGSEAMGQGELSLILMFWVVRDLVPNSILILEEPESHVSPRSQAALMNLFARACDEKGMWIIITTHSPTIIHRVPLEHVRLLVRDGDRVAIIDNCRRHQLAGVLGGGGSFRGILLVEDDAAVELTIALLDELSPDLLRQFEVISAGSEASISAALMSLPKTRSWFHLVGIYDGDQRGRVDEARLRWPAVYLPGDIGPEALLRRSLQLQGAVDLLSLELRRDRGNVVAALDSVVGLDPHDWLIECARQFAVAKGELIRALARVWLSDHAARSTAIEFIRSIERYYDA